nr:hypothetical protein BgiMline_034841 [Biomphalaria glabrata]
MVSDERLRFGTLTERLVHPTAPVLLTKSGPLGTRIRIGPGSIERAGLPYPFKSLRKTPWSVFQDGSGGRPTDSPLTPCSPGEPIQHRRAVGGTVAQSPPVELLREAEQPRSERPFLGPPAAHHRRPRHDPKAVPREAAGLIAAEKTDRSALPMESARGEAQCDAAGGSEGSRPAAAPGRAPR